MSHEHKHYVDKLQAYADALRACVPEDGGDDLTLVLALLRTPEPLLGYEDLVRDTRHLMELAPPGNAREIRLVKERCGSVPEIAIPHGCFDVAVRIVQYHHNYDCDPSWSYGYRLTYRPGKTVTMHVPLLHETPYTNIFEWCAEYLDVIQNGAAGVRTDEMRAFIGNEPDRLTRSFVRDLEKYLSVNQDSINYNEKMAALRYAQELRARIGMPTKEILARR